MSDDLISRRSLIENLNKFAPEYYTALVNDLITKEPASFDKEKVIEELRQEAMYELGIPEKKFNSDEGEYSSYCSISFSQAKRIVEKGGIE